MWKDYEIIIAWNSNLEFINIVESEFKDNIILKKQISLSPEERIKKINEIYYPIEVPHNSKRCLYTEDITIFLLQLDMSYSYSLRAEGYLLCNQIILNFKKRVREKFDYNIFHCSDSIEETKKALKVLGLDKHIPGMSIANVDDIYCIRHLKEDKNYQIVPIRDCVIVKCLMGYDADTIHSKYNLMNCPNPDNQVIHKKTIKYLVSLENLDQTNALCQIQAYHYKDKYIITDGKHRASMLYFLGNRHIFLKHALQPCSHEIIDKSLIAPEKTSHLESFNKLIYTLHNKNIKFIVIRGFKTMPKTADTDLDIIIHPDDYNLFLTIINNFIKDGSFAFNIEKKYNHSSNNTWYRAYRTLGELSNFLTNNGYQLDTYSNVFFLRKEDAVVLSQNFLNYMFENKKQKNNLFIPNEITEMVLLYCRTYFDLNGKWKEKHKIRFQELLKLINKDDFINLLNIALEEADKKILDNVDEVFNLS